MINIKFHCVPWMVCDYSNKLAIQNFDNTDTILLNNTIIIYSLEAINNKMSLWFWELKDKVLMAILLKRLIWCLNMAEYRCLIERIVSEFHYCCLTRKMISEICYYRSTKMIISVWCFGFSSKRIVSRFCFGFLIKAIISRSCFRFSIKTITVFQDFVFTFWLKQSISRFCFVFSIKTIISRFCFGFSIEMITRFCFGFSINPFRSTLYSPKGLKQTFVIWRDLNKLQ